MPKKTTFTALVFAGVLCGCAAERGAAPSVSAPAAPKTSVDAPAAESAAPVAFERRVGDYVVHMITGSFRKQPALFTERVIGREDNVWILELKLEDSDGVKVLHVRMDDNGEVKRVTRLTEKGEMPAKLADYEALLASVSVTPDENEGLTASTLGTCMVGPSELDCETKSYRVRLGEREANLGITQSAALPGRDVAGEITLADGSVLYRSELLEQGNESTPKDDSFALVEPSADAAK